MSLNWEFKDKVRHAALTDEEKKGNDVYIWAAVPLCIGEITEKNAKEWLWRFVFASKLGGAMAYTTIKEDGKPDRREEYYPTLEDVRKRIGLSVNVNTESRAAFIRKAVRSFSAWVAPEYIVEPPKVKESIPNP